ncbi:MotA/TolQ/ExbB proton channel family protein [Ponticaulis sp.]|uniref:MotA/TolQ/ExbB proton channel family protein n=1 Tax=Ponticaulis sp. TaxID=2020902 RepID=UPI000B67DBC5|nr:MotA/TolQ/ExbB proton channel family protein [Ponticaulis sp.]MAI91410.1 biopolymer transporter ExbB [Ponticaulis sp.]OUX97769.1 MAG: biopolymer transporter ExbB [Hyphomonadaceae bacterium TMED5]|tara:strand:- start:15685 stop:17070 length:1386 start_codon:yes stop_codon:yes gene_type:complete
MKTKTFSVKALAAAAMFGAGALVSALPATAQISSLTEVLDAVRRDSNELSQQNQQRLNEFRRAANEQEASMATLRSELAAANSRGQALANQVTATEGELADLRDEVTELAGDFGQLHGQFREAAQQVMPVLRNSLASAQYTGRVEGLEEVAQSQSLPTREELDRLPKAILLEMVAQSEATSFSAPVAQIGGEGETQTVEVFRVGVFNAVTVDGTRFVEMNNGSLQAFAKQPPGNFSSAMSSLINASEGTVVAAPVDPTKGTLFDTYGKLPTFNDRIEAGGTVGYVIIALGIVGVLLGLFKLISIIMMTGAMRSTAKSKTAGSGNPLARIFSVYETHRNAPVETLEMKLDEQILKESPKIERLNDILKVLASVAPLLGLLGTVIGMIVTFTAITIYGAGDPQLMADGISQALMTTVMGLCAAIPLLLIHAVCAAASRSASQLLDEQAAGLVAERAEREGAAA